MKAAVLFTFFLCIGIGTLSARQPNVVVILTDDQGWGDLSLHGNTNLDTPNIDALARAGAQFDRFYVCPVCSPTRAEFLTGRYHPRSGVYSTSAGGERINLDETTIADIFRSSGYATAAFGKWHNGMQYPYHPNGRGFGEFYGFCSGHWGDYFSPPLDHNGAIVPGEGFVIDDFTDRAMDFMETHREKPFFVYLPYNTPHSPMQVADRWWDKFRDKDLTLRNREPSKENSAHTRAALAMCENIDWNVGRVLDKLEALALADETIVVYFCDNGPNGVRWNGGMKGRKGSTDEGGVRSPLFIRWPGKVASGVRVAQVAGAIDLLPTLADLAGLDYRTEKPLDGISYRKSLLQETDSEADNRPLFSHWRDRVSVRRGRHLLDHQGQLFDLMADPEQRRAIGHENEEIVRDLSQRVARWRREVLAGSQVDKRPFPVGHSHYRYTQIPARDGTPHGGIRRSNRFPNCSYFTNWTSADDKITWPVEVLHAGRYAVELHYASSKEAAGATVTLRLGESETSAPITVASDVPPRGKENDRVPRVESYVKRFASLPLGVVDLAAGAGTLALTAAEIPVGEMLEFRLLQFVRQD